MNKFYIKNVFFLLSIFLYVNNKILATELSPGKVTKIKSKNHYPTDNSEEIYVKNKHLLCVNPEEIKNANELMDEAVTHLKYHATTIEGYELCVKYPNNNTLYYKKKHGSNTNIERTHFKIYNTGMYNGVISRLWDPDRPNFYNNGYVKIVRVYNPNLVMIEQRYEKDSKGRQKYFHALVKRAQISDNETIIVMISGNINDHNPSNAEYKNTIVESANSFTTEIDSEEDIRAGKLKKTFVNIAGYLIEKKDKCVDITYVESISGKISIFQKYIIRKALNYFSIIYKRISHINFPIP
ncbi:fam-a protein [Plasmodium chabaudi chabaudi]|uniref:Fam-a protein n=2 Tax=Plasmodium chabaudi chabaudi TaxID=31271 RepID=A0A4V0K9U1_PLACU|nr:fam-a protein [Plasmodium chabaudi chabaudi]VTZ69983.1 fam-a protein [Plasmodium chabaudi chabaudi]|eukprot:XP_016654414.1 fam-a protein [Plasmodium chabaudi chabaudi]